MKMSFRVHYDSDSNEFLIDDEKNCIINHSGSSYLRIITEDDVLRGIIYPKKRDDSNSISVTITRSPKER